MVLWWLVAFGITVVLDVVWAWCVSATAAGRSVSAGVSAAVLYVGTNLSFLVLIENRELIIPAALGAFVGTALGARRSRPDREGQPPPSAD